MSRRSLYLLLIATCALLAASLIGGQFPVEQTLQHLPTIGAIAALFAIVRRQCLSSRAIVCLVIFLWLHIVGARYIYSYVPYDTWLTSLGLGTTRKLLGWERNHFDRLVHLAFGLLAMPPMVELAERFGGIRRGWAIAFALCAVTALSAVYEIIEWIIAITLSPQQAEAYNGQQGDHWDAQKDMALALAGSLIAAARLWVGAPAAREESRKAA